MKKVYEMVITTTDGENRKRNHNLLFSTKRKANAALKRYYYKGAVYCEDEIITLSFIGDRILF